MGGNDEEVRLRMIVIRKEAQGVLQSPPTYFRRFDAFENEDHPSIFNVAVAVAVDGEGEPGHGQQARATTGRRDVMVAAVGPYHHRLHLSSAAAPLITRGKKCGIVVFLADRFGLNAAEFLSWAAANEERARRCYARDSVAMGPEDLAEMLLLDGCLVLFAVFLLRRSVREDQRPAALSRDREHGTEFIYLSADISLHMKQTRLDLLMLDNQVPFFVLAELHQRLKGTLFDQISHSIQELALSCFDDIHPGGLAIASSASASSPAAENQQQQQEQFPTNVHHLLHLFHWSRVPSGKHTVGVSSILPKEPEPHLPPATELKESLTRLKKDTTTTIGRRRRRSLDISFQRGSLGMRAVMAIPPLCVHSYSDCVFRSLIAFEQNHLRCGLGATAYSICMARLLQSEADVKLLRKRGILTHTHRTDKEIVDFFRGLRDEYADTCLPEDLLRLCKDVAAQHQQSRAARAVRRVGRQCFPKQTVTFFVIVGTIISVATLVNTIHSMYRYYHPFKGVNPYY